MKNLTLGQYYPGKSFIHAMDPRGKLTALFLYFIILFTVNDAIGLALVSVLTLIMMLCSKVPLKVYWKGSRFIIILVVFAALLNIFFTPGETLWQYGFLEITKEGLISAATMAIRLVLLILSSYVLTYTTTPMELTDALESMGAPLKKIKVPVHEIAMIMSIALRFIPTIMEEAETIKKAQQSRGVDFNIRKFHKWAENMVSLVIPLFVSAFARSEELANAMEARGYSGGDGRTMFRQLKLKASDIFMMILMGTFLLWAILYRWFS